MILLFARNDINPAGRKMDHRDCPLGLDHLYTKNNLLRTTNACCKAVRSLHRTPSRDHGDNDALARG
jgi:hypothetical protein